MKGPEHLKGRKKPLTTKSEDFFMVNDDINLDNNSFAVYHQNICGLKGKIDELISSMSPNFPHILCLSEHPLKHTEYR